MGPETFKVAATNPPSRFPTPPPLNPERRYQAVQGENGQVAIWDHHYQQWAHMTVRTCEAAGYGHYDQFGRWVVPAGHWY